MVKQFLTKPPVLVPPRNGESLLLYIVATMQVVSAALLIEREEEGHALKVQCHVYFISELYPTLRRATPKSRSSYTPSSSLRGSYATTSSHTP